MNNLFELRPKRGAKKLDGLLVKAANATMIVYRLDAEANLQYPANHPVLTVLKNYHKSLRDFIEHTTGYFEGFQDERGETSCNGGLSISELRRRRDNCDKRIKEKEEQAKIVSLTDYKKARAVKAQEQPKGAA